MSNVTITDSETGLQGAVSDAARCFVVVPRPGHYGDSTKVVSAHKTLAAAQRNAGRGYSVYEAYGMRKGDTVYRCDVANQRDLSK